jgi:hypothetical protein
VVKEGSEDSSSAVVVVVVVYQALLPLPVKYSRFYLVNRIIMK